MTNQILTSRVYPTNRRSFKNLDVLNNNLIIFMDLPYANNKFNPAILGWKCPFIIKKERGVFKWEPATYLWKED